MGNGHEYASGTLRFPGLVYAPGVLEYIDEEVIWPLLEANFALVKLAMDAQTRRWLLVKEEVRIHLVWWMADEERFTLGVAPGEHFDDQLSWLLVNTPLERI